MAYTTSEDTVTLESMVGPMMLDCPIPIVTQALLWATIEFCERTQIYANTQTRTIAAGTQNIALTPSDDAMITDLKEVLWDGDPIQPITRQDASEITKLNPTGLPLGFYRPNPETLALAPAADKAGVIKVTMILAPLRNATSIPAFLRDQHLEVLEAGAKYRLTRMSNRPWFDPQWTDFRAQFESLIGTYSIRADKDGTRRPLRTAPIF